MGEISFNQSENSKDYNSSYEVKPNALTESSSIDIMYYYRLLLRNLWKVILFSLVVGGFSALYALSLPPIYHANTTLLIENQQPNFFSFQNIYQVDTRDRYYLSTQIEILRSRSLAAKVVDEMDLTNHSFLRGQQKKNKDTPLAMIKKLFATPTVTSGQEILQKASEPKQADNIQPLKALPNEEPPPIGQGTLFQQTLFRQQLIDKIMAGLVIFPIRGTKLVSIGYSAPDAQLAADIANIFADVYIESHLEAKLEITQKASAWLSERLSDLRKDLRQSEIALQEFRERESLVDAGGVRSIDVSELEGLTEALVRMSRQKSEAAAIYSQVSSKLPLDQLLALPIVSDNAIVQTLVQDRSAANSDVLELSKRYREKHPRMISAVSKVKQIEAELRQQVNSVAKGVEVNYLTAQESEQALKQKIAAVKDRLQGVSRKEFTLRELEREVEANRQVYEVFLNRGKETNESSNIESVNARVIDKALPAKYPVKPEKKKIVMVAILFSGVFAICVILLLDWLDNTIKVPEDVEERLRVPLLGYLPLDKSNKDDKPFLGFLLADNWHFSEAVRTIRTSFVLSGLDKPAKTTLVSSSIPNEGKSTVALCLANALGQMEKVLLVDADMRKPSIGKALDISLLTPGLSNLIAQTATLEECLVRLPNSEVHVLTAGVVLGNPLDLIASDNFVKVLDMLKDKYDRIIIDSAPIQAVSDSIVIASHVDSLLYVVRSNSTSTPVVKKGLRRLSQTSARFSGVVLNHLDLDKLKIQSGYDSDYYDNYDYAYKEEDAPDTARV